MCYHMIPVATHDDRHFISQCEHGTLHLTWDRLLLSFHRDEVLFIAHTLDRYDLHSCRTLTAPGVVLVWSEDEDIGHIWLAQVGLTICANELAVLLTLFAQTRQMLTRPLPPMKDQHDLVHLAAYRPFAPPN